MKARLLKFGILCTFLISGNYIAHAQSNSNFFSTQNTPHVCATQAECDALNAGQGSSRGLNSANAPHVYPPASAQQPQTTVNGIPTTNCFKTEEEYINTPQNMGNFDWPICDQGSSNNNNSGNDSSLSDFDAVSDPNLSQFGSPFDIFDKYEPLKVPLKNQNDPANGQLGPSACGATALDMILAYYGIDVPTSDLIREAGTTNTGTNLGVLTDVAKQNGLSNTTNNSGIANTLVSLYDVFTFSDGSHSFSGLTSAVSNGNPAIVNVDLSPYDNGHALVVTGIDSNNVYVNNPWTGSAQVIDKTQFMSMWGALGYGYVVPKP